MRELLRQLPTLCLTLLICSLSSPAFALDYQIELDAPADIKPLLIQHLDIYRWRANPALDEAQLRRIYRLTPDEINTLLSTAGYFSSKTTSSLQQDGDNFIASFKVEPGEPSRVTSTTIKAIGSITDNPEKYQKWLQDTPLRLKKGDVFTQDEWATAKRDLLSSLILHQYPKAQIIKSEAQVDPDTHQVTIDILMDSGKSYQFGTTTINGLKRYPASIIERLNPITPGEPYDQAKLSEFQSKLQSTPYFQSVEILVEPDANNATHLPITVNVKEARRQKIGLGLGISSDNGPHAQVEYQHFNLLNSNLVFSSSLKVDSYTQSLDTQLKRPRDELGYIDSLRLLSEHADIEGEVTTQNSLALKRTRIKGRIETGITTQYTTEHKSVSGAIGDNLQALTLNYAWTYRNLDNLITPTQGYIFGTEIGGATSALLSDQSFVRSYNRVLYLYPISKQDSLTLRGEVGIVFAANRTGIPSDLLFRTGGDQSVRGYDYQSLGVAEGNATVGGRYLSTASVEYTRWLTPKWGAALFYDIGDAADTLSTLHPVAGYGVGARWRSPVGSLSLDLAYGEAVENYHIHFSLGSAF
jgi:translocation and assembly module TamA